MTLHPLSGIVWIQLLSLPAVEELQRTDAQLYLVGRVVMAAGIGVVILNVVACWEQAMAETTAVMATKRQIGLVFFFVLFP